MREDLVSNDEQQRKRCYKPDNKNIIITKSEKEKRKGCNDENLLRKRDVKNVKILHHYTNLQIT